MNLFLTSKAEEKGNTPQDIFTVFEDVSFDDIHFGPLAWFIGLYGFANFLNICRHLSISKRLYESRNIVLINAFIENAQTLMSTVAVHVTGQH